MKDNEFYIAALITVCLGVLFYYIGFYDGEQSGYDWGYDIAQREIESDVFCFQRIVRYDRYIDYESNIFTQGYFYNTTWEEANCGEFEQYKYETRDVLVAKSVGGNGK